jgi:hypothetical protein
MSWGFEKKTQMHQQTFLPFQVGHHILTHPKI